MDLAAKEMFSEPEDRSVEIIQINTNRKKSRSWGNRASKSQGNLSNDLIQRSADLFLKEVKYCRHMSHVISQSYSALLL